MTFRLRNMIAFKKLSFNMSETVKFKIYWFVLNNYIAFIEKTPM